MKKLLITILILACGIIIGLVAYDTYLGITEDFPDGFVDKYKNCPKCVPYIKIEEPAIIALDSTPYLATIRELNNKIFDLNKKTSCYEAKCISFSPPGCN